MPAFPRIAIFLALGLLAAPVKPAAAADPLHRHCLSKAEQRAAVASHKAISLGRAIRSAHKHGRRGETLRARLCRRGGRLAYVLTLLARNGKVLRVTVDAANGAVLGRR
ncbi:MAG TPA: hypothetical protein VFT69_08900 [Pseudolabrys sp.]|jgi:uncharacterized membrane protein YkoI|nr:hypothetical protein [Pseudolabrys sp.]